jgi:hypothetical protein
MLNANELQAVVSSGRTITPATPGDLALGDLTQMPGTWANTDNLVGHGWNMIALPYKEPGRVVNPNTPDQKSEFRLLLNQFNETLAFSTVDKGVPNRGAAFAQVFDRDQHLAALQYIQHIVQIAAVDSPQTADTADTPKGSAGIHHEPGLFLHLFSQTDGGPDIARLATIPHGTAVLALGSGAVVNGPPIFDHIGDFSPLPLGVDADVDHNPYLAPYKHFKDNPFKNLFNPTDPLALLKAAVHGVNIKTTTGAYARRRIGDRRHPQHSIRGQTGQRQSDAGCFLDRGTGGPRRAGESAVHVAVRATRPTRLLPHRPPGCETYQVAPHFDQHHETHRKAHELKTRSPTKRRFTRRENGVRPCHCRKLNPASK